MALLALPKPARGQPILVRADSAGATHAFVDDLVGRKLWFSVGFDCDQRVREAILALPERAFTPALDPDGRPRRGAWVAELTSLDLASSGWPEGIRAICRRERPHPGARHKLGFTDAAGHRFQVFITNQPDPDPTILEARHRPHAHVEDRIRTAKASGLRNLPCFDFGANDAWLTLVMVAQTLVCWAQALLLDGDCKVAEPKTLRYRLWHVAGRIVRHARRIIVRIDRAWPWAATWSQRSPGCEACPRAADHGTPSQSSPAATCQWVSGLPAWPPPGHEHRHDAAHARADYAEPGGPVDVLVSVACSNLTQPYQASHCLHNPAGLRVGSAGGASAVPACCTRRQIPPAATSIRACGSPAHGSPTPFTAGIRPLPPRLERPWGHDDPVQVNQAELVRDLEADHRPAPRA